MRHLAEQFRRCATETRLPKYIELLNHAANQLEVQAELFSIHEDDAPMAPHHLDIHI